MGAGSVPLRTSGEKKGVIEMKFFNAAKKYASTFVAGAVATVASVATFPAYAALTLDVTPITDILDEGPDYVILIAAAIFATIGLMFVISKIRQLVKA